MSQIEVKIMNKDIPIQELTLSHGIEFIGICCSCGTDIFENVPGYDNCHFTTNAGDLYCHPDC